MYFTLLGRASAAGQQQRLKRTSNPDLESARSVHLSMLVDFAGLAFSTSRLAFVKHEEKRSTYSENIDRCDRDYSPRFGREKSFFSDVWIRKRRQPDTGRCVTRHQERYE